MNEHEKAKEWADAMAHKGRARHVENEARQDHERADVRVKNAEIALLKSVGPNVPTLVFAVDPGRVVIVEHEKGIRLLEVVQK